MTPTLRTLALAAALILGGRAADAAGCPNPGSCLYLRASSASQLAEIAQTHGLTLLGSAHPQVPNLSLAEAPAGTPLASLLAALAADERVAGSEAAEVASLCEQGPGSTLDSVALDAAFSITLNGLSSAPASGQFGGGAWRGYLDQPSAERIRLPETHALPSVEAQGSGVVAVIDTGIDPEHPLLGGALIGGYDFLTEQAGLPSEWLALDPATRDQSKTDLEAAAEQSYSTVVEGLGEPVPKGPGVEVLVEQSYSTVVEGEELPAAFGHGTMVAGIVRMTAPGAKIMPLRAFDGDGTAELWNVIRAVYYAIFAGADVINMSFSVNQHSPELEAAINFAKMLGVVCVSSTGNEGASSFTYPAAHGNVLGVASTNDDDELSAFSNYGVGLTTVAAPGEGIVTLYPGGFFAAAWGTSFSSAFVSGAVALLHDVVGAPPASVVHNIPFGLAELAVQDSAYNPTGDTGWGAGRLDARGAFSLGLVGY